MQAVQISDILLFNVLKNKLSSKEAAQEQIPYIVTKDFVQAKIAEVET